MRIRTLMALAFVAGGLVLGTASLAAAQTTTTAKKAEGTTETTKAGEAKVETTKAGEAKAETTSETSEPQLGFNLEQLKADRHTQYEAYECFEEQLQKATPDFYECAKAPSPIIPAMNELLYGSLAFIVLLGFMIWKGLPALKKGMDGRTERIRTDLARAEEARVEAETVLAQYQQQVASSKGEATRIIEDARATAEATKAELHRRAEAEIAEMKQRAAADIESAKAQAINDLKSQVASLAIGAAEVVVQKSLDPATQTALIDNYINQVTASSN